MQPRTWVTDFAVAVAVGCKAVGLVLDCCQGTEFKIAITEISSE